PETCILRVSGGYRCLDRATMAREDVKTRSGAQSASSPVPNPEIFATSPRPAQRGVSAASHARTSPELRLGNLVLPRCCGRLGAVRAGGVEPLRGNGAP